ncbi:hypothetical protein PVAP13_4KG392600 [Panicum virgatum]|uniref:RNA polymerase I-specific transcription initiation factor RRN3 n=1 Tax=Panicum virgatum TaxID=38727 RepID=A0A8T0TUU3_PANVG|nr:hypothetical protein PVAP13_4KG392600 [Panicum virgatum]
MGAEECCDDHMEVSISDSLAFREVQRVLQSVRMDPFLIDLRDKDEYDYLLLAVDPTRKRDLDEEAMLVTTLKALSEAVPKIDIMYHHALLNNIFTMCIWYLREDTRDALLDLITRLAAVADQYLRECLQMLVNNFAPPRPLVPTTEQPRWLARKKEIYYQLHESLKMISDTVPLAARILKDIINRSMPKLFDTKAKMVSFVECMLGLDTERLGDLIGSTLLEKVVDLLTELDEYCILKTIFQKAVLKVHKSKFAQFIMFYACSLDPEICGVDFALFLTDIFTKEEDDAIARMSAVSYVGSYLARARFISADTVVAVLKRLVEWCDSYCKLKRDPLKPIDHQIFYASCQAVMYVLCFRLRSIMDYPNLKSQLFQMPIESILMDRLEPLKVCLPSIVNEFLRQARAARLFNAPVDLPLEDIVESDLSKAFGGANRLDMFFPFDPYLLRESDRYIRPNFEFWSLVQTTYSNNSDDDEELGDLDAPGMNVDSLDDHIEIDFKDDDDIEYSMNKMSITPHRSFHPMAMSSGSGLSMPARIRPSVSPPS